MRVPPAALFLRDRLIYVLVAFAMIGIGICLMLLENARYPGMMDASTIYYFTAAASFFFHTWTRRGLYSPTRVLQTAERECAKGF